MENQLEHPNHRLLTESQHLRHIFPEEIWGIILERITESKTLENISKSSEFLRSFVIDNIPNAKFPEVFDILIKTLYKPGASNAQANNQLFKQFLVLRQTCKLWRDTVDRVYQQENRPDIPVTEERHVFEFSRQGRSLAGHLQKHFEHSHRQSGRNPFVGRRVRLIKGDSNYVPVTEDDDGYFDEDDQVSQFMAIRNMLLSYGSHIWYLSFESDRIVHYPEYHRLQRLLELTPNVKELTIALKFRIDGEERRLVQFPALESLEKLSTHNMPPFVLHHILRTNNPTITTLDLFCGLWNNEEMRTYNIISVNLPRLKHLKIGYCTDADILRLKDQQVSWRLETLSIMFLNGWLRNLEQIFEVLKQKWQFTLKEVHLDFTKANPESLVFDQRHEGVMPKLELPRVEKLKLEFPCDINLDFIMPMKNNLKSLEVVVAESDYLCSNEEKKNKLKNAAVKAEESIRFIQEFETPGLSNIWEVFPKLEKVKCASGITAGDIKNWSVTRKQYEWITGTTSTRDKVENPRKMPRLSM